MRLTLALLLAPLVFSQTPKRLQFEVASVRPVATLVGAGAQTPANAQVNPRQVRLTYLTMRDFITRAYRVRAYQVIGPEWIVTDRYDIIATLPEGATTAQVPEMMQSLLEDRFGLKVHNSQKEFTVYTLSRNKRPFTLTEVQPRDSDNQVATTGVNQGRSSPGGLALNLARGGLLVFADNKFDGKGMSMDMLANNMYAFLGLPTVNNTDVKGFYDIQIAVTPDDFNLMMGKAAATRGVQYSVEELAEINASTPQSFLDGLDKVGLKVEKGKAPLEVINIDELKKTPTEN
jgi:uncharacterized protein (TIGR03435 family)